MTVATGVLAALIGYILGSIPSAYLIGRLKGKDLREVGDSRIGTAAAARNLGIGYAVIVGFMDFAKGTMSVLVAQALGVTLPIVFLVGVAAMVGHNWSLFMGFKGGRGSMTCYGVLAWLIPWHFFSAMALVGIFYAVVRKPTLATALALIMLSVTIYIENASDLSLLPREPEPSPLTALLPPLLAIPMFLKPMVSRRDKKLSSR